MKQRFGWIACHLIAPSHYLKQFWLFIICYLSYENISCWRSSMPQQFKHISQTNYSTTISKQQNTGIMVGQIKLTTESVLVCRKVMEKLNISPRLHTSVHTTRMPNVRGRQRACNQLPSCKLRRLIRKSEPIGKGQADDVLERVSYQLRLELGLKRPQTLRKYPKQHSDLSCSIPVMSILPR